jgi:hypothetical protein
VDLVAGDSLRPRLSVDVIPRQRELARLVGAGYNGKASILETEDALVDLVVLLKRWVRPESGQRGPHDAQVF